MDSNLNYYLLIFCIAVLDASAILCSRFYHEYKQNWMLAFALSLFAASGFVYVKLLAYAVTAVINIIYIGLSTITVTVVCYFLFKEKLNWQQIIGILLIVTGITFLK